MTRWGTLNLSYAHDTCQSSGFGMVIECVGGCVDGCDEVVDVDEIGAVGGEDYVGTFAVEAI